MSDESSTVTIENML